MGIECAYSFWDLYVAAIGKNPSKKTKDKFALLSQEGKNKQVSNWASIAGWKTQKKIGSDKKIYIAFFP